MNKDQKLLEEAYQKVLQEETALERALRGIEANSKDYAKEAERKKEEKLKDLSQVIAGQLGTDEKGNFVYKPSGYEHGKFYKSYNITSLFNKDLKEIGSRTPIEVGMFWTQQGINTKEVYRAKNVHGRLVVEKVLPQEAKEKGLSYLMSERELQAEANENFGGNVDEALGWILAHSLPIKFGVKFYEPERVFRALEARRQAVEGVSYALKAIEDIIEKYKKAFKEHEIDSTLSKDFDIGALEDF